MRVKELWSLVPVPQTVVKHLYSSLTLSKYTIIFTVSLLIYTITLSSLHLSSYVTTHTADSTLSNLMAVASIRTNLIPVITTNQQGQDVLQLCDAIPNGASDQRCSTVFVPSPTATQPEVPNNAENAPSTTSSESPRTTQSVVTPEAANAPFTTVISSTTAPGQDNLLAATPTSLSSTSTPAANATTSLALGIAEVVLPTSSNSTASTVSAKSDDASTTEISSTAVTSSSDTTSTDAPAPTDDSTSTVAPSETSSVETTASTVDAVTSVPPLITSIPPLTTSIPPLITLSQDRSTTEAFTTSTTTSENQTATTLESTSTTDENSATSTSTDSISTTQNSTTSEVSSTSTVESPTTSTSSVDVSIASEEPSSTADGILSIETAPLSTTSTPSSTSANSSAVPKTTSSGIPDSPDRGTGPEVPQDDSPSLQPLPDVNISSVNSSSLQSGPNVPDRRAVLRRRSLSATPVTNSSGAITGLNITGLQADGSQTFLDLGCAGALTLVEEQMHESWTEDLVMVGYHIWLLLLGSFAIASESIPHTLASLFSTIVALVWSASQLSESRTFRNQFAQFITNGACDGVDLLPTYWGSRMKVDVAIFALDALAVVLFGFLGAKLVKDYRKRMSVVVGLGEERRVYKTVLLLSVVIQIGAFLQLASLSLWVQQLFTSPIALASSSTKTFKPLSLLSILVTIPWLILGLFAIRRESKPLMLTFIIIDVAFIGEWVVFFSSDVYRLVFTKWTFFAAGTVGSFAVLVGCLMSGILAWMQFGRGLSEKLAQSILDPVDTTPWEFSSTTEKAWEPFGTEKSVAKSHALGGSIGGGNPTHKPSSSFERTLDPFSSNPGFGTGGLGINNVAGIGYGVGYTGNYGSLGFGKPLGGDHRPGSNLTSLTGSSERESTAFSYGLRSPAPPVPEKKQEYLSRFSN